MSWYERASPRLPRSLERALAQTERWCGEERRGNGLARAIEGLSASPARMPLAMSMVIGTVVEDGLVHTAMLRAGFVYVGDGYDFDASDRMYMLPRVVAAASARDEDEDEDDEAAGTEECFEKQKQRDTEDKEDCIDMIVKIRTVQHGLTGADTFILVIGMISFVENGNGERATRDDAESSVVTESAATSSISARMSATHMHTTRVSFEAIHSKPERARDAWRKLIDQFATPMRLQITERHIEQRRRQRERMKNKQAQREPRSPMQKLAETRDVPLFSLPTDVLHKIVSKLSATDLCCCMASCRYLNKTCDDNELWVHHCQRDFQLWPEYRSMEYRESSKGDEAMMNADNGASEGPQRCREAAANIDVSDARFVYADKMDQKREMRRKHARQKREQQELQRRMSQHRRITQNFGNYGRLPFNYGILYPPRGAGGGIFDEW